MMMNQFALYLLNLEQPYVCDYC